MDDGTTIIPPNKKRVPGLLIFGLGTTAFAVFLLHVMPVKTYYGDIAGRVIESLIILVPLFYTSAGLVDYLRTLFDKNAALFITSRGIEDNLGTLSCGQIAWHEIAGAEIATILNMRVLMISLSRPENVINRQPFLRRRLLMRYVKRGRAPVVISEKRVVYDLVKLRDIINSHVAK